MQGRRAIVVGLGVSGFAAARALVAAGARVLVTESGSGGQIETRAAALRAAGIGVETGGHNLEQSADIAIVSPGIPPSAPPVVELRRRGVEIISEIELAYRLSDCDFLAVTGTNGKTTTTSLLAAMLAEGGVKCAAAGNIGMPLIEAIAQVPAEGAIALEVSSFQLDTIDRFRAVVAVVLNVAEDHTDWHGDFNAYSAAKARIVENQLAGDTFVFNADDPIAVRISERAPAGTLPFSAHRRLDEGLWIEDRNLVYNGTFLVAMNDIPLPGIPGIEDVAAAAGAALSYEVEARAVVRAIKGFRPLAHRLEVVAEIDGVTYVDDSKATNPHATLAAVSGMNDVVLIAGGRSKGIDLSPLANTSPPVRAVIAIGEASPELEEVFRAIVPVERATDMVDAVARAKHHSIRGGSVLLSPGCASLDMFTSYAERGEVFARAVRALGGGEDRHE